MEKMMNNTTKNIFQMQHDKFLFLGKEYSDKELDFGKIFGDFFQTGGYDQIIPYLKDKDDCCVDTLVFYKKSPEYKTVYIGRIVDEITTAPDDHVLETFPAGEFVVVTTEWQSTEGEAHQAIDENEKTMQAPNGYEREDESSPYICGESSPYICIEKMFECPERGHRWERWYPIRKVD